METHFRSQRATHFVQKKRHISDSSHLVHVPRLFEQRVFTESVLSEADIHSLSKKS